jgi:hypothetical protein
MGAGRGSQRERPSGRRYLRGSVRVRGLAACGALGTHYLFAAFRRTQRMANAAPAGRCIFCDQPGLTKEHLWPDWLKRFLPRKATTHHTTNMSAIAGNEVLAPEPQLTRQTGDIKSRRLRVVCRACNNGWMGRLQEVAKPKLVPLLRGTWSELSAGDCEALSAWAVMFTIIVERLDVNTAAVTAAERRVFSLDRRPPANWIVWAGRCEHWPPWDFYHRGWGLFSEPSAIFMSNEHCSQTTTFKVGKLLLHTYSTTAPLDEAIDVDPVVFALKHGLCPIWPLTGMPYVAPNLLSPAEVNAIAHDLTSRLGVPVIIPPDASYRGFTTE